MATTSTPRTERGRGSERNQDDYLCDDALGLYVVCDGMGPRGGVASTLATDLIAGHVSEVAERSDADEASLHDAALQRTVVQALQAANAGVHARAQEPGMAGVRTTATAVWIQSGLAAMAHVGSSRLYLVRDGRAYQMSTDHTLAAELTLARKDVPPGADSVPTRSLGAHPHAHIEALVFPVDAGDRLVLMTRGAAGSTNPADPTWAAVGSAPDVAEGLVSRAWPVGVDDATVVVVDVGPQAVEQATDDLFTRLLDLMRAHPILEGLDEGQRLRILHAGTVRTVPRGTTLAQAGAPVDRAWLIVDGELELCVDGHVVTRLERGHMPGWSRLLRPGPATGTLRARTTVRAFELTTASFRGLVFRRPYIGLAVTAALFERARAGRQDVV